MKLYYTPGLPNPRRVTIYLAEKGIDIERVEVNLKAGEQRTLEFLEKNPIGKVPLLELDDGSYLPESTAIVEYLEERFPTPPMLGATPEERAQTRATERIVCDIFGRHSIITHHTHPAMKKLLPTLVQYPDAAKAVQPLLDQVLDFLEARVGAHSFLCGERPMVPDCSFFALVDAAAERFDWELPARCVRLKAWFERFRQRASAKVA